jgi:hypothetical protein
MPEAVLRYLSNSSAFCLFGKAQNQIIFQGLNLLVCLFAPSLCDFNLALKSGVEPVMF